MGSVLCIAAYGRTPEKLCDKSGATMPALSTPAPSFGSTPVATPAPAPVQSSFGGGFNSTPTPSASKFGKVVPQDDQPAL
jgi:hypothetical protein